MKILKKILLVLLILVVLLVVVGLFLPSKYHVERSIAIQAKPEAVFPWVNNLKKWNEWSPWTKEKDPTLVYNFDGPEEGPGAISKWDGKKFGDGSMRITESSETTGVKYALSFNHGKYLSTSTMAFEPQGGATTVRWSTDGDMGGNPINRYLGLLMGKMMGPDFEEGLAKLKLKVEGK
jgi:hypothetical protein